MAHKVQLFNSFLNATNINLFRNLTCVGINLFILENMYITRTLPPLGR